jgi:hypothetical protein
VSAPDWGAALSLPPESLVDATLELHWAVQLVASAGQTFAQPRADDSHRAMTWSGELRAFVGEPFAGPYPFRVALRPEDLTLLLVDRTDQTLGALPLIGRTREEGYEWMSLGMATYLGGPPPKLERPEYDVPDHPVRGNARFTGGAEAARRTLTALYDWAAALVQELVRSRDDASVVRCWPHHFDIASLITLETDDEGEPTRTIGVGLAPMGGGYGSWYLYVTPWPYPEPGALPALPEPGAWHTEGWTGAVLTGTAVAALPDAERSVRVRAFLGGALAAAYTALSGSSARD